MNKKNINIKTIIIIVLHILLFFVIIDYLFYKEKEGFNPAKEIKKLVKRIKKTEKAVGKIPKQMAKIEKKIQNTTEIFTNKLRSIFTQIGDMFNNGLIIPLTTMFIGLGNVFVQIFNIIEKIGNKITSLPGCIIVFAIQSTIDTFVLMYKTITPKIIKEPVSFIYKYTFRYIFDFIGWLTGYNESFKKCYGFNVSTEIGKMNSNFNDIQKSFKDNFGNLNFSKIKI